MKLNRFKPAYALSALAIVSIIIASALYVWNSPNSAQANDPEPIVSMEQGWFYVDNSEPLKVTLTLDKPADTDEPSVTMLLSGYTMVCDPGCHFEQVNDREAWAGYWFGSESDGNAKTKATQPLAGWVKSYWPEVVYPQKALVVTRLSSVTNAQIASGHDEFTVPHIVSSQARPASEGEESYVSIHLDHASTEPVSVHYELIDETAVWNVDYLAKRSGTVTFQPGKKRIKIPYQATQNDLYNGPKTFSVALSSPQHKPFSIFTKGDPAVAVIENDDEGAPTLTAELTSESIDLPYYAYFDYEFTINKPIGSPVTIEYVTALMELKDGNDYYTVFPGEVYGTTIIEIPAGETSTTTRVSASPYYWGKNALKVVSASNAVFDGTFGEYIVKPPPTVTAELTSDSAVGPNAFFEYEFTLDEPTTVPVTIEYAFAFMELKDGNDYYTVVPDQVYGTTTIKIEAGEKSITETLDNPASWGKFALRVTGVSEALFDGVFDEYIFNEQPPTMTVELSERVDAQGAYFDYEFALDEPTTVPVTIEYATALVELKDGNDHYTLVSGDVYSTSTIKIEAGEKSTTTRLNMPSMGGKIALKVTGVSEALFDGVFDEYIFNEQPPTMTVELSERVDAQGGAYFDYEFTLDESTTAPVTIEYVSVLMRLVEGNDHYTRYYTFGTTTIEIAAGDTSVVAQLSTAKDTAPLGYKTALKVTDVSNALFDGPLDEYIIKQPPTLTVELSERVDKLGAHYEYEFTLDEPTTAPVTIEYVNAHMQLKDGNDYYTPHRRIVYDTTTIEIPAGKKTVTKQFTLGNSFFSWGEKSAIKVVGVSKALFDGALDEYIVKQPPTLTVDISERKDQTTIYFDYEFTLDEPTTTHVTIGYVPELMKLDGNNRYAPHSAYDTTTIEIEAGDTSIVARHSLDISTHNLGHKIAIKPLSASNAIFDGTFGEHIVINPDDAPPPVEKEKPDNPPTPPDDKEEPTEALRVMTIENALTIGQPGQKPSFILEIDKPISLRDKHILATTTVSFYDIVCNPHCRFQKMDSATRTIKSSMPRGAPHETQLTENILLPQSQHGSNMIAMLVEIEGVENAILGEIEDVRLPSIVSVADHNSLEGSVSRMIIHLSGANPEPVSVSYKLNDGTAALGTDYDATQSGTVTFAPGNGDQQIEIPYRAFDNEGKNELKTFEAVLEQITDGDAILVDGSKKATVTIVDDEGEPELTYTINSDIQADVDIVDFNLSHPTADTVEVIYKAVRSYRNGGRVYRTPSSVTFAPGETHKTARYKISASPESAHYGEERDWFRIEIDDVEGATYGYSDDTRTVEVGNARVVEGQVAEFQITLSEPVNEDVVVTYVAKEMPRDIGVQNKNIANMGFDYKREKRTVTIGAGSVSTLAYIWTLEDDRHESDEQFIVEVVSISSSSYTFHNKSGIVTIEDNDGTSPTMYIKSIELVDQEGEQFIEIRLRLTHSSHEPITKDLDVFSSWGAADTPEGTTQVTFPAGSTRHVLRLRFNDPT